MIGCKNCDVRLLLQEALEVERTRNKELQDKLVAMANPVAYHSLNNQGSDNDPDDYYGVGPEEFVDFNEFGEKIIVSEKK